MDIKNKQPIVIRTENITSGSTHTHFESIFDTGNDLEEMCDNFVKNGARSVAVTEHGLFSSFEDLKDIVNTKKSMGLYPDYFEVIPGIEAYFDMSPYGENFKRAHLILIAKDYEGYQSLSRIVSESGEFVDDKGIHRNLVTMDNLMRNVDKGHLICTSACINGPLASFLGLQEMTLLEKIEKYEPVLKAVNYDENIKIVNEYEDMDARQKAFRKQKVSVFNRKGEPTECTPTQTNLDKYKKFVEKYNDEKDVISYNRLKDAVDELNNYLEWVNNPENFKKYTEALAHIKPKRGQEIDGYTSANITIAAREFNEAKELLDQINYDERFVEAENMYKQFESIFGKEDFYFELQNHGIPFENTIYNNIAELAYRVGNPNFIAANDIHVGCRKEDADYEKFLRRRNYAQFSRKDEISGKAYMIYRPISDEDRELCIKSDDELREWLSRTIIDHQGHSSNEIIDIAIGNIRGALDKCHVEFPKNATYYPKFAEDENKTFIELVRAGAKERFPNGFPSPEYEARLEREIDVITSMGYAGYHLIVQDYLDYGRWLGYVPEDKINESPFDLNELKQWVKDNGWTRIGYSVGPGRGSAAGSLSCFCLGITDLDPMPYNLLFERFLNVERVSMPDIDSDFRPDIRARVEDYCRAKYGEHCICKIMTKSYGDVKSNLRGAARYLGTKEAFESFEGSIEEIRVEADDNTEDIGASARENKLIEKEQKAAGEENRRRWAKIADSLCKLVGEDGQLPEDAIKTEEERELVDWMEYLQGIHMGYGEHAAGTIIASKDLRNILPLHWNNSSNAIETQCNMAQAEAMGLLKMDFLGLDNLKSITNILQKPLSKEFDWTLVVPEEREKMLKDPKVYAEIYAKGLTQGVFQVESPGMKKMLKQFKPESFEDIILLIAAYRPGPMQYIPEIINWKWYNKAKANGEEFWLRYSDEHPTEPERVPIDQPPTSSISLRGKVSALDKILDPTYGCPIYQEQIMQIFQEMAGYSLGGADLVRRAMSKKKKSVLESEKSTFIHGDPARGIEGACKRHGITEQEAADLFEQLMPFAEYGFNKSHAAAYSLVSVFTAYQKLYHTKEFFRETLNADRVIKKRKDTYPPLFRDMKEFGIELLPPDILFSKSKFEVEDISGGKVGMRFGISSVKDISESADYDTIEYRTKNAQEFIEMNPKVSIKTVEKFAALGMFDSRWYWKNNQSYNSKEINKVAGNRHVVTKWVKNCGEDLRARIIAKENIENLQLEKKQLQTKLDNLVANRTSDVPSVEESDTRSNILKIDKDIAKLNEKVTELGQKLNNYFKTENQKMRDKGIENYKETDAEIIKDRDYEMDKLYTLFTYKESLEKVQTCPEFTQYQRTFDDLVENGPNLNIPCVVLSCGKAGRTKSGNPYYPVQLMDANGTIRECRCSKPVNIAEGIFNVPPNRWFNIKPELDKKTGRETYRNLNNELVVTETPVSELSAEETINKLAAGAKLKTEMYGGKFVGALSESNQQEEVEER